MKDKKTKRSSRNEKNVIVEVKKKLTGRLTTAEKKISKLEDSTE